MEADPNNQVVFVAGALRSGTTFFRIMLDQHPEISNPGEFDFLFDGTERDQGMISAIEYRKLLRHNRIFLANNLVLNKISDVESQVRDLVAQLNRPGTVLAMNIHRNFERAFEIFPRAKFLHLIRDPRDVARSSIGMGWAGNVYFGVDHWIKSERGWAKLQKIIGENQYLDIDFESLVDDPRSTLSKVCDFVGVPYSETMLKFPENSTYGPPDPALATQWEKRLSAHEIQLVEFKVGDLLTERGYAVSLNRKFKPAPWELTKLWIHNCWQKNLFAVGRYGFSLWLQEKIFRIFRVQALWVRCRLKMNSISEKHLR